MEIKELKFERILEYPVWKIAWRANLPAFTYTGLVEYPDNRKILKMTSTEE